MSFPSPLDVLDDIMQNLAGNTEEADRLRIKRALLILWLHDHGEPLGKIAKTYDVTRQTVNQWIRPHRGVPGTTAASIPAAIHSLDCTYLALGAHATQIARLRRERARQILRLHKHDGVPLVAIAEHLGVTRQTVDQWLRPYR